MQCFLLKEMQGSLTLLSSQKVLSPFEPHCFASQSQLLKKGTQLIRWSSLKAQHLQPRQLMSLPHVSSLFLVFYCLIVLQGLQPRKPLNRHATIEC